MRLRILVVAVLLIIVTGQAVAAPAGHQQYIVKTKHVVTPSHTKAAPSVQDFVRSGGGHVDYEWRDRLVVTLPDSAVQALVQHPAVEFVQKVVSGIPDTATATASGADPVVTSSAFRTVPKSFPPWTSGTYSYDGQGNITAIGSNAYSYDAFSRLATSTTNGIPETYTYDRYGNLTQKKTGTGSTALTVVSDVDDGNHLSGHCYDKGGNLTDDDPVHCPTTTETYSFDALNRMTVKWNHVTHTKEYYIYNANDERIAVIPCSETACTEQITFSFRDESGKVLRQFEVPYQQFDSPWTWVEDYVYRDAVLLAAERMPAQGGRRYFHTDHLGTPRLVTNSNGRRISEHDYFPFGVEATPLRQETLPVNGYNREEPMKFTGHERDFSAGTSAENSNYIDYMHARSTVPQWGRFLTVDPVEDVKAATTNPQAWNRYAYVLNNPLRFRDPDGRCPVGIAVSFGLTICYSYDIANKVTGNHLPSGAPRFDADAYSKTEFESGRDYGIEEDYGAEMTIMAPVTSIMRSAPTALSIGRKMDFLFDNNIEQSIAHNAERAAGNAAAMRNAGIADTAANRTVIARYLSKALNDTTSIVAQNGSRITREVFIMGTNSKGVLIQFIEEKGQVISLIAKSAK